MLIEFSFGNFRSFKDIQSLNMSAAKITSKHKELDQNNLYQAGKNKLLKSKAIYGANASGKSNVVRAFYVFREIVAKSVKDDEMLKTINPFSLSTETENEPTFFQLIFKSNGTNYRYGFEATSKKITSEWLYGTPNLREVPYFIREENKIVEINKLHFKEGIPLISVYDNEDGDNQLFRSNSLFLSTVTTLNGKLSKQLNTEINSVLAVQGLDDEILHEFGKRKLQAWGSEKFNEFLELADTGIDKVGIVEIDNVLGKKEEVVVSYHSKFDDQNKKVGQHRFDFMKEESEGTQKMFGISPFLILALRYGGTLMIDEFDARLHPLITKKIVELFNSPENKYGAQLIFITHDTNLLSADLLRRDQIEFVEKDKYGASHLYSLAQFKGIRNNASFEKDYIRGKYGGIPFVGDLKHLFFKNEADAEKN